VQKLDHNIGFEGKLHFFAEIFLANIAENGTHNIDPVCAKIVTFDASLILSYPEYCP
jgi:hypothetical protein